MYHFIISISAPDVLSDEKAAFQTFVEELSQVLSLHGMHIDRVGWTSCDSQGAEVSASADELHFHLSGDANTRKVQFILQLLALQKGGYHDKTFMKLPTWGIGIPQTATWFPRMTAVKDAWLLVFGRPFVNLAEVPFVCNTSRWKPLLEELYQAENKDYRSSLLFRNLLDSMHDDSKNWKTVGDKECDKARRENVQQVMAKLDRAAVDIMEAALLIVRMSGPTDSPRWQAAAERFWRGDLEGADAVLELPKIKAEFRKAAREARQAETESLMAEAMLKVRLIVAEHQDDWDEKLAPIFKACAACARYGLPKTAWAGLMTEYAHCMGLVYKSPNSRLLYERVLPVWRDLAEEDPDTCLPELAHALYDYGYLLDHYDFEGVYDVVKRDRERCHLYDPAADPETAYTEALALYRRLAENAPDLSRAYQASAAVALGNYLFMNAYAKKAQQACAEALAIYRDLAKVDPVFYLPIWADKLESIVRCVHQGDIARGLYCEEALEVYERIAFDVFGNYTDELIEKIGKMKENLDKIRARQTENTELYAKIKADLRAAERGDRNAQCRMGEYYENGAGGVHDVEEAEYWYGEAAKNGLLEAQIYLGSCLHSGDFWKKDDRKAAEWYRMAALQGDATAQHELAQICIYSSQLTHHYEEAVWWLHELAEHPTLSDEEMSEIYYELGYCYENGFGVPQNWLIASEWYKKGRDLNYNPYCSFRLGMLYHYGKGVTKDYSMALKCYTDAKYDGGVRGAQKMINILLKDMSRTRPS